MRITLRHIVVGCTVGLLMLWLSAAPMKAQESGFVPLFDGKTLNGWTGAKYVVEDGMLVCPTEGGGYLRTEKQYDDFALRFEFRLGPGGNNGVAIRAPASGNAAYEGMEIQILDDSAAQYAKLRPAQYHGSIYDVVPAKRGAQKPPGEWNTQEIMANGRLIRITLNGQVIVEANLDHITDPEVLKRHPGLQQGIGHIGFMGHGARIEFRNIQISELHPDNRPPPGYVRLFTGENLTNWKGLVASPPKRALMTPQELATAQEAADQRMREHWTVEDGVLMFDGKGDSLCTKLDYKDFELIVDWKIGAGGDSGIYLRGSPQVGIWDNPIGSGGLYNNKQPENPSNALVKADNPIGEWNRFRITMVGEKVTVYLNGVLVVDNVTMENYWERDKPIYPTGQIELQDHNNPLWFKSIFIRELEPVMGEVAPGKLLMDPPTLENLGFRWYIEGDSNRNASVAMSYRKKGDEQWKDALPMLRVHHEVANQEYGPYRCGNLFAGSILGLQPDTEYEVRLVMADPDGGAPGPRVGVARTRGEPKVFEGGRKLHVYPAGFKGKRAPGSVVGLMAAHDAAQPGDILLLHAGVYKGPFTFTKSGAPGKPIVFRGGVDGEAILEGTGHEQDLLNIDGTSYLTFEHLTFRRAATTISAGQNGTPGASNLVVRRCKIVDVVTGLYTYSENSTNWYIADNVLEGFNPTWYPRPQEYMSPAHSGLKIYGRGHVVCYNRISRFSDALAIANYGTPVPDIEKHCVAIDFYNNDLSWAQDDCIETDYGCHNIRVYNNRGYNAHTGLSVQPSFGGPIYLIRNEIYGVTGIPFKLHNFCTGMQIYNNTVCCARSGFSSFSRWQNGCFRNNLFLGGKSATAEDQLYAMSTGSITPYTTLDYDGYRRNAPGDLIRWYDGFKSATYTSLEDFTKGSGHETHGIMVDYDAFAKAAPPGEGITSDPAKYDLRPKPGAAIVDAGCVVPGVTEGYTGKAPDMGCYELGKPLPHYGPRL